MSRGLGKLQRTILDYLQTKDAPCWMSEVTQVVAVVEPARDGVPSRSAHVSVRRAIRALEARGLVQCGQSEWELDRDEGQRVLCWLPHHPAPAVKPILRTGDVADLVLETLRRAPSVSDPIERMMMRQVPRPYQYVLRERDGVSYQWLVHQVKHALDYVLEEDHKAVAIHRAIKQLERRGIIAPTWSRHGRCVWVKLVHDAG